MLRRSALVLAGLCLAAALAFPSAASAIRVHVRIEGKTTTIYGASEPLLRPFVGTLPADGGATVDLTRPTPLGALEAASMRGEFFYRVLVESFGPYVSQIGRYAAGGTTGWVYKVNGVSPPVGADSYVLRDGDVVLWYYAQFGIVAGGPPTLDLVPAGRGCFRAALVDDNGKRKPAQDVVFELDGRRVSSPSGRLCPAGEWHRLRATRGGAIRSQVISR